MNVISLSPAMNRRLSFEHELKDLIDERSLHGEALEAEVRKWLKTRKPEDRDDLILAMMWLPMDYVARFRAHWVETRRFTDDMFGVGLEALTEYVNVLQTDEDFLKSVSQFIHNRIRDFVNDNRSTISASRATNQRRDQEDRPLEYNFAQQLSEGMVGVDDLNPCYVDILDAVERLAECDREDMHNLITMFLKQEHGIDEASLSDEERQAVERLSEIGRDLL
jgi:hypothetical protein